MSVVLTRELDHEILEVKLNRPDRFNALNEEVIGSMIEIFKGLNRDRNTRVVILTGEGRGFCSGADLRAEDSQAGSVPGTEGMSDLGYVYKYQEYLAEMILAIHDCDKPVIAAVNGAAAGGGLSIAAACDIRIGSEKSKYGAVYIKTGLSGCDVGSSYFLPRLMGLSAATDLMLTGRVIDAQEAQQLGLISRVVAPESLMNEALATAKEIRSNSEYGVWMTRKGLRTNLDAPSLRHAMEIENRQQVLGYFSGCMEEAMASFQERRPPQWKQL